MIDLEVLKSRLGLVPHPEGGFFKETYRSSDMIKPPPHFAGESRSSSTGIYFLLGSGDISAFHRIKSDETWFFHSGSTLSIHTIEPDGRLSTLKLGDQALIPDAHYQVTIKANTWFAASVNEPDSYVLSSCYVSPGFDFRDFELADRSALIAAFSQHEGLISRFTHSAALTPGA